MRCKPGDFEVLTPVHGSSCHVYTTADPREMVEGENYFLQVTDRLKRGDTIEVTFDDGESLSWVKYMVSERSRLAIKIMTLVDAAVTAKALEVVESRDDSLKLTKLHKGFGRFDIVDEQGVVLVEVKGKEYAQDIVDGKEAIPDQSDIDRADRTEAQEAAA